MTDHRDEEARALLRERQGAGARYDSPAAPAQDLLLARRGTAFFARHLNGLTDPELDGLSGSPGLSRRHVIAQVAFQARRLARLVAAARLGLDVETIVEPELHAEDVDLAATLPAHALRYLFRHSEVHLNVEWRDLGDQGWARSVTAADGQLVRIRDTPAMRARAIWNGALALNSRARMADIPTVLYQTGRHGWKGDPGRGQ